MPDKCGIPTEYPQWDDGYATGAAGPPLSRVGYLCWIYCLVDPRDGTVRYVGGSRCPKDRLRQHRYAPGKTIVGWVRELALEGKAPSLRVLGCAVNPREAEAEWIAFFRERGKLYNVSDGGEYLPIRAKKERTRPRRKYRGPFGFD